MAEYIDRTEALEITTRTCGDYATAWSEIRKLPAADVAPVVKCQDCKYCLYSHDGHIQCSNPMGLICPAYNAYCCYGEEA